MKKLLAIISVFFLLIPAIAIAGFDENGYNWKSSMFKGSGDKWIFNVPADYEVTAKWSDNFDLTLSSGTQENGAWLTQTYKRPDHTSEKGWIECGNITDYLHTTIWSNCFIVKEK